MYRELEKKILEWAEDKGILKNATPFKQSMKTLEEVQELIEAVESDNKPEIVDALGDILVTIIIQAEMQNLDLMHCLQSAYDVISKRTGRMIDGKFIKDHD